MKRKLQKQELTKAILSLIAAFTLAASLAGRAAENTNAPAKSDAQKRYEQALAKEQVFAKAGKSGDWKDPDKVLPEVSYDGLPISEIARTLREQFKDAFDVILPGLLEGTPEGVAPRDWQSTVVDLRLKNVTASEVFNAMNLSFEINHTPLRWELTMNGNRPTALLRVLEDPKPIIVPKQPKRTIFFVGDLIEKKKPGDTIVSIVQTLSDVYKMTFRKSADQLIQIHNEAELLIVTGTDDEVELIRDTLGALKEKAKANARRLMQWTPDAPKPEPTPAKTKTP